MAFSAEFIYRIIDKYSPTISKMDRITQGFRLRMLYAGEASDKMGAKLGKLSSRLANLRTGFAAMMLFRGLKASTKASLDFSTSMFKVQAWTGASAEKMTMLRKEAMRLNKETKFTALNVAESMGLLGKRGFDPDTIKRLVPVIAGLATAGGDTTMPQVTEALADALTIYKEGATQAVKYSDMMATASAGAAFDMLQLVDAFGRAGGMTEAVGMDFKTTVAILGALAEKQERGARAGTRLEMSIAHLLSPTRKGLKALKELDVTYRDVFTSKGKLRFVNFLGLVDKSLLSSKDKATAMVDIFGRRGSKVMIRLR